MWALSQIRHAGMLREYAPFLREEAEVREKLKAERANTATISEMLRTHVATKATKQARLEESKRILGDLLRQQQQHERAEAATEARNKVVAVEAVPAILPNEEPAHAASPPPTQHATRSNTTVKLVRMREQCTEELKGLLVGFKWDSSHIEGLGASRSTTAAMLSRVAGALQMHTALKLWVIGFRVRGLQL